MNYPGTGYHLHRTYGPRIQKRPRSRVGWLSTQSRITITSRNATRAWSCSWPTSSS